jgi:hypothetical protein
MWPNLYSSNDAKCIFIFLAPGCKVESTECSIGVGSKALAEKWKS